MKRHLIIVWSWYSFSRIAITKYQGWGAYTTKIYYLTVWGLEVQDQGVGSSEASLFGLLMATSLLYIHTVFPLCVCLVLLI